MADDIDEMGPIDFMVIEFPGGTTFGEGLPLLVDLVDNHTVRILDLVFVRKDGSGVLSPVGPDQLKAAGARDLSMFEGAASGLIGADDLASIGEVLDVNTVSAVIVYENTWAAPLARALRRGGGQLVAGGRIPVQELIAALDATEPAA